MKNLMKNLKKNSIILLIITLTVLVFVLKDDFPEIVRKINNSRFVSVLLIGENDMNWSINDIKDKIDMLLSKKGVFLDLMYSKGTLDDMINQSYITGGLNKLIYQYIDDASARVAQIISKKNVGDSGGFSRILGLNNVISFLNPDLDYDCGTNNLIPQFIPNKDILSMLEGRYYKLNYNSNLRKIGPNDSFLIGQTILLRSPITCASAAAGHGVCHHCYGDLAYTNTDINIGRIATEIITSQYTQMRLSAKHLLEAKLKEILWVNEFYNFFRIDINTINLRDDLDMKTFKGWKFVFNFDDIQLENDDDFFQHKFYMGDMYSETDETPLYNEYINEFKVVDPDGNEYKIDADIDGEDGVKAKLFITASLSKLIREHISIDDESDDIIINLTELDKIPIFLVKMENNDLGKSLDEFNELINKKAVTKQFNIPELLQKIQLNTKKGGIHCTSVHLEIILMNQVRSAKNRLMMPNWRNYNEKIRCSILPIYSRRKYHQKRR